MHILILESILICTFVVNLVQDYLTFQDQLTTVIQVNDNKFDITNGILTIRQFEITMEGKIYSTIVYFSC